MSKPKSFIVLYNGKFIRAYEESEADKYISELQERVSEERSAKVDYKISANDLSEGLAQAYAENRHHKYKLCLAMAKSCEYRFMNLEKMINTDYRTKKMRLSQRWWARWNRLAYKFKEAK